MPTMVIRYAIPNLRIINHTVRPPGGSITWQSKSVPNELDLCSRRSPCRLAAFVAHDTADSCRCRTFDHARGLLSYGHQLKRRQYRGVSSINSRMVDVAHRQDICCVQGEKTIAPNAERICVLHAYRVPAAH